MKQDKEPYGEPESPKSSESTGTNASYPEPESQSNATGDPEPPVGSGPCNNELTGDDSKEPW
jgi:hypothetical protein